MVSFQDVLNKDLTRCLSNEAWQVTESIMLTAEENGYSGTRPRNSFEPNKGVRHFGTVELVGRYRRVRIDNAAFPLFADPKTAAQRAEEQGIGINWYLNRFVKLTTDYEHTNFRMALSTVTPLHDENVLMSRFQLAF
jgi:phosphate-selective porin OprO and OprP